MLPKIIAIVGPTASGKTKLGIEIAKRMNGEIISVDSRQVYRGMDIGTAKVGKDRKVPEDRKEKANLLYPEPVEGCVCVVNGISHWGIDLVEPNESFNVSDFKKYAEQKIEEILSRGHVPILVGGTGLWLSALIDNYDLTQTASDSELRAELEKRSAADLFEEYKKIDPKGAEVIDKENKRRIVRALEVIKLTNKPFSGQQTKGKPKYDVLQIGLLVDRAELYRRIDARVDEMIERGLVDEVRSLKEKFGCETESMTGIGYRQICDYLDGKVTLPQAIEEIKKATRNYAKRQMTWFRRDPRIIWISSPEQALNLVNIK